MTMETLITTNVIFLKQLSLITHKEREVMSRTKSNRHGIKTKKRIDMENVLPELF